MENKFKTILYDERWDPSDVALVGHHKKWVIFDIKEGDDERKVDILINFVLHLSQISKMSTFLIMNQRIREGSSRVIEQDDVRSPDFTVKEVYV